MANKPPFIPPPFDDTPLPVPEAPAPAREHASNALAGLAWNARASILKSLSRVQGHSSMPATDSTGRSFLVLGTANTAISQLVETIVPGSPFSISVFTDADGNDRWLPAISSVLAYDGEFWFSPFMPTLEATPISFYTEATAPVIPAGGINVYLEMAIEIDDTRPLVPEDLVYPVKVTSVSVRVQEFSEAPPEDDLQGGLAYRPWFTIGPAVDGVRPVDYQTLGYCHFWLFVRLLVPPPSESSSSQDSAGSSSSSTPPAHQASFPMWSGRKLTFPTWGMILAPLPAFRMTMRVTLRSGKLSTRKTIPPEWTGSVRPGSARIVCAAPDRHGDAPVLCEIRENAVLVHCARPETFHRRMTIQFSGLLADGPTEHQYTSTAGREHNQRFWSTTP